MSHPGNSFYRDEIQKNMARIIDKNDNTPAKVIAAEIVQVITKERGGVFLRANEERGGWHVMDEASAVTKVILAMKNCESKALKAKNSETKALNAKNCESKALNAKNCENEALNAKNCESKVLNAKNCENEALNAKNCESEALNAKNCESKVHKAKRRCNGGVSAADLGYKNNQKIKRKKAAVTVSENGSSLLPLEYKEGRPPKKAAFSFVYEVKEGPTVTLDQYTKGIINLMCSQTNPNDAASVLDKPLINHFKAMNDESDQQRIVRLQLRQRYIAAMTIGISPVNFSKKLMETWGGSILERMVAIDNGPKQADGNCSAINPLVKGEDAAPAGMNHDSPIRIGGDAVVNSTGEVIAVKTDDDAIDRLVNAEDAAPLRVQNDPPTKVEDDALVKISNGVPVKAEDHAGLISTREVTAEGRLGLVNAITPN